VKISPTIRCYIVVFTNPLSREVATINLKIELDSSAILVSICQLPLNASYSKWKN